MPNSALYADIGAPTQEPLQYVIVCNDSGGLVIRSPLWGTVDSIQGIRLII